MFVLMRRTLYGRAWLCKPLMMTPQKPHCSQSRHPLDFLSGRFTGSDLDWSTLENEAYAIVATTKRMHWMLATVDGFDFYTDHLNLVFLFDPVSVVADLSQTCLQKVLRWPVRLRAYNYTSVHIDGNENVWANLLGRWATPCVV